MTDHALPVENRGDIFVETWTGRAGRGTVRFPLVREAVYPRAWTRRAARGDDERAG
jgi:hypothetical protein